MHHKVTLCVHDLIFYFDTDLTIITIISEQGQIIYCPTYLLTYLLHGAESFLRS